MKLNKEKVANFRNGKLGISFNTNTDSNDLLCEISGQKYLGARSGIYYMLNGMSCISFERHGIPTVDLKYFLNEALKPLLKVVVKQSVVGSWYHGRVGETFDVYECDDNRHYVLADDPELFLYKKYCVEMHSDARLFSKEELTEFAKEMCKHFSSTETVLKPHEYITTFINHLNNKF